MKEFYRSLRYLRPYRGRIAASVVLVLFIATLWGGGLSMAAPVIKVIVDPEGEGLHGWAWRSAVEDRLGVTLSRQNAAHVQGQPRSDVVSVSKLDKDSPAGSAGLTKDGWIVGVRVDGAWKEGQGTLRSLALEAEGQPVALRIYRPGAAPDKQLQDIEVSPKKPGLASRWLLWAMTRINEPASMPDRWPLFVWVLGVLLAVNVLRSLLRFFQEYLVETATLRAMMDLRQDVYNVALRLPMTFYSSHGTSDAMSRMLQDSGELRRGQVALVGKTVVEPAKAVASITIALIYGWKLTLIVMLVGPPTYWLIRKFAKKMKRASRKALEGLSAMLSVLEETLTGIRVVKAYTMESTERKRFFRANRALLTEQESIARIDAATTPVVESIGMTCGIAAAAGAGWLVMHDKMSVTDFFTWMVALFAMFDPVKKLAEVGNRFHAADAAAKRMFQLMDRPVELRVPGAPTLLPHSRNIEFRNVTFRYPNASSDAMSDVNLSIRVGQTVAIVGPNGSGKTTMVSLLPRLIDPTSGGVFIDGSDIGQVSLRSLRRQIAVVTQDAVLFHATIGQNISYGLRHPHEQAVKAASLKAFVDEFVSELPDGYDTIVGEHGATLSGGQKQRISIARAILRDPRILIFDEAMSQVDAQSEQRIHQAMEGFVKGRTTLLIAHRFATVLSADMIVVMDLGRIVDCGTHEQLLTRCEVYQHLYRTQFAATGG